jgi:hypothetical protein
MTDITALQALGTGKLELSPSLKVELSSLGDSSRMACSDSDPLRAMPPTEEVGQGFPSVPLSSRVVLVLRWMALEKVLEVVAPWCWL